MSERMSPEEFARSANRWIKVGQAREEAEVNEQARELLPEEEEPQTERLFPDARRETIEIGG